MIFRILHLCLLFILVPAPLAAQFDNPDFARPTPIQPTLDLPAQGGPLPDFFSDGFEAFICTILDCIDGCCVDGMCISGISCDNCAAFGQICTGDTDCCSNNCDNGACRESAHSCRLSGSECGVDEDCCAGSCDINIDGVPRCSHPNQCEALGESCSQSSDCCSLFCNAQQQCATGDSCLVAGTMCVADADCCSSSCVGGFCEATPDCGSLGEACTGSSDCCSGVCSDGRCNFHHFCRAEGELCDVAGDCCSGTCDPATGRCQVLDSCQTAFEPGGGSRQCCTGALGETGIDAATHCPPLSGCALQGEICVDDDNCCSGSCGPPLPSGLRRCENLPGCNPAGELCGEGHSNNCCGPGGGGSEYCAETPTTGLSRCWPNLDEPCLKVGEPCAFADQCCDARCLQSEVSPTGFVCSAECVPLGGGTCRTDGDCCQGGVCQQGMCVDGGLDCRPYGTACEFTSDCCTGQCNEGFCQL